MVLAAPGAAVPTPTCIVRLLATRGDDILTIVRDDGQGLDIPSARVGDSPVEEALAALVLSALGAPQPATLLGYVKNVVTEPADDYPWPVPDAHFAVWHIRAERSLSGRWLPAHAARRELGERHWWPLAAHVLGIAC